jgi:hypothetical protein
MRIKANFTVFPRKMPSGRIVFYFQCYDETLTPPKFRRDFS